MPNPRKKFKFKKFKYVEESIKNKELKKIWDFYGMVVNIYIYIQSTYKVFFFLSKLCSVAFSVSLLNYVIIFSVILKSRLKEINEIQNSMLKPRML